MSAAVEVSVRFFAVSFRASLLGKTHLSLEGLEPGDRMISLVAADPASPWGVDELVSQPFFTNVVDEVGTIGQLVDLAANYEFNAVFMRLGELPPSSGKKSGK